jgi:hypothetical protein
MNLGSGDIGRHYAPHFDTLRDLLHIFMMLSASCRLDLAGQQCSRPMELALVGENDGTRDSRRFSDSCDLRTRLQFMHQRVTSSQSR